MINNLKTIDKNVFKAFSDFIKLYLPEESIHRLDSNFSVPQGPYAALRMMQMIPTSPRPLAVIRDGAAASTIASMYLCTVIIRFFGDLSFQKAALTAHYLKDDTATNVLSQSGIGYSQHSAISNDSIAIDNTKIEDRATLSVQFYVTIAHDEIGTLPGTIETVDTPGTYIN